MRELDFIDDKPIVVKSNVGEDRTGIGGGSEGCPSISKGI